MIIKTLIIFLLAFSSIEANNMQSECEVNMTELFESFYGAQKLEIEEKNTIAVEKYKISIQAAYNALNNCQGSATYDSSKLQNFITRAEQRLCEIQ